MGGLETPVKYLEFLVSLDVGFHGRWRERAVSDRKSLEKLEFGGPQAAAASAGGPVWPELTKRPNFAYRVKIDISALSKNLRLLISAQPGKPTGFIAQFSKCLCALKASIR